MAMRMSSTVTPRAAGGIELATASGALYFFTNNDLDALRDYFAKERSREEQCKHIDEIVERVKAEIRRGSAVRIDQHCPMLDDFAVGSCRSYKAGPTTITITLP